MLVPAPREEAAPDGATVLMTVVPPRKFGVAVLSLSARARVVVPEPKTCKPVTPVPLLVNLELKTTSPAPRTMRARVEAATSFWTVRDVPTSPMVRVEPARASTE